MSTTEATANPTLATPAPAPFLPEVAAFGVILVWGSTFTLTKALYSEMSPLAYGATRFMVIVALAFLVLYLGARREGRLDRMRIRRADLPMFILTGIFGYTFYQLGFMLSLEHTSPFAVSLLIAASSPLVSLLIVTILGEMPSPLVWLGAAVAVAGVTIFLFSGDAESKMLGNAIALGAGISFALYQMLNRRLIREYPSATYSAWSTLFGAVPIFIVGIPAMMDQSWSSVSTSSWLVYLYMCIFPVYLAYIVWGWAIRHRGVAITGFSLMMPIVAGVISWLFYDEEFGFRKIIGGALAVAGLVWMQWANHRRIRSARVMEAA